MDCIRMGLEKVRMEEADLKARRKLKDKEDGTGEQRAKDKSHWARGSKREGSMPPMGDQRDAGGG